MKREHTSFYLLVFSIFLIILSPNLFSDGMFMDGLLYAAISKNLAHGIGSFWDLHLTNTLFPHFHEHPPLMFGLQSMFFKLLGDSILVERIYSLLTCLITAFIVVKIWKTITAGKYEQYGWLPLLFIMSVPLITWAACNNMLENTMMIFTSLSIFFSIKSINSNRFVYLSISGLSLFLAFLTKGFVGLFPLSIFFWCFIFQSGVGIKRAIIDTSLLIVVTILPFVVLSLINSESIDSLYAYFNQQIVGSIKNVTTVNSRFFIVWKMLLELAPMLILVILISSLTRKITIENPLRKWAYILLSVALSGVIPIMISMKQRGFYILPSFPFFGIAFAILIVPKVHYFISKINAQNRAFILFKRTSFILAILSMIMVVVNIKRVGRDQEKINDVYQLIELIPKKETISIQPDLYTDWTLHGYFQRYNEISLDGTTPFKNKFVLARKNWQDASLLKEYEKTNVDLLLFDFYVKKNN